jgi:hypothetical protein
VALFIRGSPPNCSQSDHWQLGAHLRKQALEASHMLVIVSRLPQQVQQLHRVTLVRYVDSGLTDGLRGLQMTAGSSARSVYARAQAAILYQQPFHRGPTPL